MKCLLLIFILLLQFYCFLFEILNNKNSTDELILKNGSFFIEETIKVKNLSIFPSTYITFINSTTKIIVENGSVSVLGKENCPIMISQLNNSQDNFDFLNEGKKN